MTVTRRGLLSAMAQLGGAGAAYETLVALDFLKPPTVQAASLALPKDSGAGKTVVILEDVTTTGGSAMEAVKAVEEAGAKVALVLSILDRGEGAADLYASAGIPFKSLFRAEEFLHD